MADAHRLLTHQALEELVQWHRSATAAAAAELPVRPLSDVVVRRRWLRAPYVEQKSALVVAIAAASRCHSTRTVEPGYCVLVGRPYDLEAAELLMDCLLALAKARSHELHSDVSLSERDPRLHTQELRREFWLAFADATSRRLRAEVVAETEQAAALRAHEERLQTAVERWLPAALRRVSLLDDRETRRDLMGPESEAGDVGTPSNTDHSNVVVELARRRGMADA